MKTSTLFAYLVIVIALCANFYFTFVLKPSSVNAFLFLCVWLSAPYVAMGIGLFFLHKGGGASVRWSVLAILISVGGVAHLVDVIYLHRDAQGAIAVLLTPILQVIAAAILAPLTWWLSSDARR